MAKINQCVFVFRLWAGCIKTPSEEESNACQRESMRHIISKRPKFAINADKLDGAINMKQVRLSTGSCLDYDL